MLHFSHIWPFAELFLAAGSAIYGYSRAKFRMADLRLWQASVALRRLDRSEQILFWAATASIISPAVSAYLSQF